MLLFLVTASAMCCHWAISAPAATLRTGRRFSGALSGTEPRFPVLVNAMSVQYTVIPADKTEIRHSMRRSTGGPICASTWLACVIRITHDRIRTWGENGCGSSEVSC